MENESTSFPTSKTSPSLRPEDEHQLVLGGLRASLWSIVSAPPRSTQFLSAKVTRADLHPEPGSTDRCRAGKVEAKLKTLANFLCVENQVSASEPGCYSELAHKENRTPVGKRTKQLLRDLSRRHKLHDLLRTAAKKK